MNALVTRIGLIVIVAGIAVGSGKASAGTVTYHVSTQFESDLQYGHTLEIPYYDPSLHGGAALLRGWYSYTMTGSKPIEVFNQGPESGTVTVAFDELAYIFGDAGFASFNRSPVETLVVGPYGDVQFSEGNFTTSGFVPFGINGWPVGSGTFLAGVNASTDILSIATDLPNVSIDKKGYSCGSFDLTVHFVFADTGVTVGSAPVPERPRSPRPASPDWPPWEPRGDDAERSPERASTPDPCPALVPPDSGGVFFWRGLMASW
jgi:hypothetical protein